MLESRVVRYRGAPVSWLVMHLPGKLTALCAAVFALCACAAVHLQAQESSSQSPPSEASTPQAPAPPTYISINPLENVRYDNRYDMSLGFAYDHMKAGPTLLQGSNLGGLNLESSYWLTRNWGIQATGRAYVGNSGTAPNAPNDIRGPMVKQYFFVGGAEWLGPHNRHGDLIAHAMFGGVYGNFQKDLLGQPPAKFDFYYNQIAPAAIIGGEMDLNRSEHWVFRITPDAVLTHYTFSNAPYTSSSFSQYDLNFALSVGLEYKFTKFKRSTNKKKNWVSGW
jgi:hypothetical protein